MNNRHWHFLNFFIFFVLFGANLVIFLNRNNGFAYVAHAGYHEVYTPAEKAVIRSIRQEQESVIVSMNDGMWRADRSSPYVEAAVIQLKPGKNLYVLESRLGKKITLGLNFTPSEEYIKQKRQRGDVLELYYSSAPVTNSHIRATGDWLYLDERATTMEKTQALALIGSAMHIGPSERSEVKVLKTAGYLLQNLDTKRGIPAQFMDTLSPLKRFTAAMSGQSKVWCGDLSSIFSYFMNLEGVPTRLVTMEGSVGDALRAGHVFNEVYLKEIQKWALVDLTSRAILVKNPQGELLNTQEVFSAHKVCPEMLNVTTFNRQLLQDTSYAQVKGFYDYYFQVNSHFVYYLRSQFMNNTYSTFNKGVRYLLPAPTFLVFDPTEKTDNMLFYLKQTFACAILLFLLYWLVAYSTTRKKPAV